MTSVAVIDYGMGNLRSVSKALEHVAPGAEIWVTSDPRRITQADRVLFPGVGAIRDCMAELRARALDAVVKECAGSRPFLGICLGMQAIMEFSEENGGTPGLGILPGQVRRFPSAGDAAGAGVLKIPHMGWNEVHQTYAHPLWRGIPQDSRFYFVHSYYVVPSSEELCAGKTPYGLPFSSAVARKNIFAIQFHPEKSQRPGLTLLENFARWDGTV